MLLTGIVERLTNIDKIELVGTYEYEDDDDNSITDDTEIILHTVIVITDCKKL